MRLTRYFVAWLAPLLAGVAVAADSFTLVALPDTQNYVTSSANADLFTQQTQWIADQIQVEGNPRNIQFVSHLGDVVSHGSDLTEWARADASMAVLDGVAPYGILPGNHDYASTGDKSTGTSNYVDYFGPQRFDSASWYGGADSSGNNSYQYFSAGGYDFIHLALEWRPTVNAPFREVSPIAWAQSVIDANPHTPVILSTHENLDDEPTGRSGAGEAMWNQLVSGNDQIFMVLNGHYHSVGGMNDGEYHQESLNKADRPVFEILQDYQDYPNGGDGWLRLIEFDIPSNKIRVETYSPVLDQYQTETVAEVGPFASQFEFSVDFASRLTPVLIPPDEPPPPPDLVFREGHNGYTGAFDKELRSSGGDATNGQEATISIDGDDGSPGLQPNHGLIRFEDLIGANVNQLTAGASIEKALLVLEVANPGSGFTMHEVLADWDEQSTWQSLGDGVQANGTEARAAAIAVVGADSGGENVPVGPLEIDVTATIQAYQEGVVENLGWALLPFAEGTNGVDFYSSEFADLTLRPALHIFLAPTTGDYDGDGLVDTNDFLAWKARYGDADELLADGNGDQLVDAIDYAIWRTALAKSLADRALPTPAPSSVALLCCTLFALGAGRRTEANCRMHQPSAPAPLVP